MINYATVVWGVANLLHPFMIELYWQSDQSLGGMIFSILYLAPVSIPSLLFSMLFLHLIKKIRIPVLLRYALWIICIPLVVLLNLEVFVFFLSGELFFEAEIVQFLMPAVIAAVLATFIFGPYFFKQMREADILRNDKRVAV